MLDFDPRDDNRDDERDGTNTGREGRRNADEYERDDDWSQPEVCSRDRDDDGRTLGRGPANDSRASHVDENSRDRNHDAWLPDRDRDPRERNIDPRDVFARNLDLPRGLEREIVRDRNREYTLRGSESRTLATLGAFRVVSSLDLRDHHDRPADLRSGDLRHLREQGLIETIRVPGFRGHAVALTKEGRSLLEHHRDRDEGHRQTFWDGIKRERELEHDLQVYRAYEQAEDRLLDRGAHIERVVLDHELKSEYQRWLHERDKEHDDYDGHPDRRPMRFANGRTNTTCRTSMTRSTSPMSASSIRSRMAAGNARTSRS